MIDKFISMLPSKLDGAIILSSVNRLFFTGFDASDGVLILTRNGSVFLTDSRYIEEAQRIVRCCEVVELKKFSEQVPAFCKELGCSVMGVEADRLTVSELKAYRKALRGITLTTAGTDKAIDSVRMVKTDDEVQKILKAQSIAEDAFNHVISFIREGVTEKEIALTLDYYMLSHGADALSFETIAITGANTSKPHGVPSSAKVKRGDFITMDYGAVVDGYHSDMTRTVAVGEVSDKQVEVYNTVLDAQMKALSVLKPGVRCADADKTARDVIINAGYGEYFRHSTGHGVGIEIHEKPNLSPNSKQILKVGNVVTVEPGIYIPGEFGVRTEDMALITDDGYKNLTKTGKKLLLLDC